MSDLATARKIKELFDFIRSDEYEHPPKGMKMLLRDRMQHLASLLRVEATAVYLGPAPLPPTRTGEIEDL